MRFSPPLINKTAGPKVVEIISAHVARIKSGKVRGKGDGSYRACTLKFGGVYITAELKKSPAADAAVPSAGFTL